MLRLLHLPLLAAALGAAPAHCAQADVQKEAATAPLAADSSARALAKACAGRDGWSDAAPPARIFGNNYYVGTCGISVVLITSDQGHVLIDSGTIGAAPLVLASIRKLGLKPEDVRWIISSHEHYDHVGALAELQQATGARVAALPTMARALDSGRASVDDPQATSLDRFAPVKVDKVLHEGESLTLRALKFTPYATPAHSPGSTSWTWQSCDDAGDCRTMTYADSATTISADGYRFHDHADRMAQIERGIAAVAALPCDVLITPHPSASHLFERFAGQEPLADRQACANYAERARATYSKRLTLETTETASEPN